MPGAAGSRLRAPACRSQRDDVRRVEHAGHGAKNLLERLLFPDPAAEETGGAPERLALARPDGVQDERGRTHVQQDALECRGPLGDLPDPEADLVPFALLLLAVARTLPVIELEVASDGAQAVDRALQIEPQDLGARRLRNRPGSPPTAEENDLRTGSRGASAVVPRRHRCRLAACRPARFSIE